MKRFAEQDGPEWRVLDVDRDELIRHVEWVDEDTGEYGQAVTTDDGGFVYEIGENGYRRIKHEVKRGNVKLVRV